ncbi:hypothetical protein I8752_09045 [Nostocaceae cyanobacterium CENA369]|jgi:hypothetical protein|uniref:Uncharacterized protein n=1 Tax=Dendronalium phyllosphericum CENA369 TaxID=1725256 RepID=A0A8J7LGN8_9NOST|nr:hypothetical protein [Dendronalium phyllosphericum]MBH8573159.1 hypothetical protein [Dendronalium phyllosphericum CENA369]
MKASFLLRLFALCSILEFLLNLSFATPAKSEIKIQSVTLPEWVVFDKDFNPPGQGEPKDSSGAGSRSRFKCS